MKRNISDLKKKAHLCQVTPIRGDQFRVQSPSGQSYIVRPQVEHCECKWNKYTGKACAHLIAVEAFVDDLRGRGTSVWQKREEAKRQRRPTSQVGDIFLTHRKKETTPTVTWVVGRMTATHSSGYDAGVAVYIRHTKSATATKWIIFNGLPGFPSLSVDSDKAKTIVATDRHEGRPVVAKNQTIIEWAYQRSFGRG